jgi:hypothetical protein
VLSYAILGYEDTIADLRDKVSSGVAACGCEDEEARLNKKELVHA